MTRLARAVAAAQRWLVGIYRLDIELSAWQFLVQPDAARRLLPEPSPRSGLVVVEEEDGLSLGLYVDPRDRGDLATIVEETSHLVCLAWHAAQGRPVSRLILELQGEVDRFAVSRLAGRDPFGHFRDFTWAGWMDGATRDLYATASRAAERYCRGLSRRHPDRADTPELLSELRHYYRAPHESKLNAA